MTKRLFLLLPLLPLLIPTIYADQVDIFDGKTLDGWKGDPSFWSVQDGAITGKSTAENPCKSTTYLTYTKKEFSNFELTVKFRFLSKDGNSGIQYRSQWHDEKKFQIKGYQADLETGNNYSGILYEQNGRGIVAKRGQHLKITPDGKKNILPKPLASAAKAQESNKLGEWNTYRIVAEGNTLTHQINGHTTVIVEDNDPKKKAAKGLLALQLHQGPSMTIQYKDLEVLELDHDTTPAPKDTSNLKALPGFKVEKIYTVNKETEGSWV